MSPREVVYERPRLYAKQKSAFFNEARYSLIEASTKSGKTHGGIVWLYEQAVAAPKQGRAFWWCSPVYPQAKIAYRRLLAAIPTGHRKGNESALTIALPNGSTIWFKSGEKPDNLYGEDVYAAIIDEASRFREEAWWAIRSTLTKTGGAVRIIGNVKGRRNWFYTLARKAEAGAQDMAYHKITAHEAVNAGIITKEEVEDARAQLPDAVFRELFMAEPSDDGGNPFGIKHIHDCIAPLSTALPVGFGVDLAKSVDFTAVVGLDRSGRVCAFERWQSPWTETIERIHSMIGRTKALVDSTGVGDPVLETLQRGGRSHLIEGYKFTSESKQKIMEGLAVGIQQHKIFFPDGPIRMELEAYEYEYTRTGVRYAAAGSAHDDCVCALALAWSLIGSGAILKAAPAQIKRNNGYSSPGFYRDGSVY